MVVENIPDAVGMCFHDWIRASGGRETGDEETNAQFHTVLGNVLLALQVRFTRKWNNTQNLRNLHAGNPCVLSCTGSF